MGAKNMSTDPNVTAAFASAMSNVLTPKPKEVDVNLAAQNCNRRLRDQIRILKTLGPALRATFTITLQIGTLASSINISSLPTPAAFQTSLISALNVTAFANINMTVNNFTEPKVVNPASDPDSSAAVGSQAALPLLAALLVGLVW